MASASASAPAPQQALPQLMQQLMARHKRCLGLQAPPCGSSALVSAERLKTYDEEGYSTMTHDRPRNAIYRGAIRQAVAGGCERFIEIGCGGDACLTRMVLDEAGTTVAAFEGNEGAASAAYAGLLHTGYCESRYSIHAVLSTAPALGEVAARSSIQAVLQEVLGYIASREGVVPVFRDLQRRLGRGSWAALPSHCATFFMPTLVQLSEVRHNLTHSLSLLGGLGGHAVKRGKAALFLDAEGRGGRGSASASAGGSRDSSSSSSSSADLLSASFLLVSRLPMREDVCPFWKCHSKALGTGMPLCGALEFLSLEEDMEAQLQQLRTASFTATRRSVVNSLSCFIWVGFNPPQLEGGGGGCGARGAGRGSECASDSPSQGSASTSSSAASRGSARGSGGAGSGGAGSSSRPPASATPPQQRTMRSAGPMDLGPGGGTAYPYGVPGLPVLRSRALALSTAQSDRLELVANNWPNVVVWLPQPITLEAGQQLQVQSWADLEADPHVYCALLGEAPSSFFFLGASSTGTLTQTHFSSPRLRAAGWRYRVLTSGRKRQREEAGAEGEEERVPWSAPLTLDSRDGVFNEL